MKKIFTLTTTILLSVSLFALAPEAKLTINNNSNSNVTVTIDGINYTAYSNSDKRTDIIINNVSMGRHSVKVYQQVYNRNILSIIFNSNRQQLIYNANIVVRPQYATDITINRSGDVYVSQVLMARDFDGHNYRYDDWGKGNRYHQAMDARSFDQLKYSISKTYNKSNKLFIAKQAIASSYFTANQVSEIVWLFNSKRSKLDIAKFSYANTIDKQNYNVVSNALGYNTSRNKLARFINSSR
jgi:hypothetical protein